MTICSHLPGVYNKLVLFGFGDMFVSAIIRKFCRNILLIKYVLFRPIFYYTIVFLVIRTSKVLLRLDALIFEQNFRLSVICILKFDYLNFHWTFNRHHFYIYLYCYRLSQLLFGWPKANYGSFSRGEPHIPMLITTFF